MLPREERLDAEMLELVGAQQAWGLKVSFELAIEERVGLVFERLDRLIGHGYDHNFNCTNFEGAWVNLVHAGRGPRLQLHNDGSVWVFRDMDRIATIDAGDAAGFGRLLESIHKPFLVQIAWYRLMHRYGGYSLLFLGAIFGVVTFVSNLFR